MHDIDSKTATSSTLRGRFSRILRYGILAALFPIPSTLMAEQPDLDTVIRELQLESHVEGGYFRRTFQADHRARVETETGPRYTLTSIYYLLTHDSRIGHWHLNPRLKIWRGVTLGKGCMFKSVIWNSIKRRS